MDDSGLIVMLWGFFPFELRLLVNKNKQKHFGGAEKKQWIKVPARCSLDRHKDLMEFLGTQEKKNVKVRIPQRTFIVHISHLGIMEQPDYKEVTLELWNSLITKRSPWNYGTA